MTSGVEDAPEPQDPQASPHGPPPGSEGAAAGQPLGAPVAAAGADAAASVHELPLVVDLDGTLIKTDLLLETFLLLLKKNPLFLFLVPLWLVRGKEVLKAEIATRVEIDAPRLPWQDSVLEWLREEKARGRTVVLATASHHSLAEEVASHLDLFDAVLATAPGTNLKGARKLAALKERFGTAFVYVGDTFADVPIWREAQGGVCVASSKKAARLARESRVEFQRVFEPMGRSALRAAVKAIRPHQWAKNLLIFVPLFLAHKVTDATAVVQTLIAFAAFSLLASSVYVLNDLLDVGNDRHHPRKRLRPFAAGDLSILVGLALFPLLFLVAIGLALAVPRPEFWLVLVIYYAVTMAYSFGLKSLVLVDVFVLAGLYTVRIVAGSAATAIPVSFWLFAFSMFVFLCLAFVKRYVELLALKEAGKEKTVGRGYHTGDIEQLQSLGSAAGYVSVLVLALYLNSADVVKLYSRPALLWAMVPLVLFWISRVWVRAGRGEVHDDPIVFALKDPTSWIVGLLCGALVLGAA